MIRSRNLLCWPLLLGLLVAGCATKPVLRVKDFGYEDAISIKIDKYHENPYEYRLWLGLHPKDIIVNVDLAVEGFGQRIRLDHDYMIESQDNTPAYINANPSENQLLFKFVMDPRYTIVPESNRITVYITYLAHHHLYWEFKLRGVYELQTITRTIHYKPLLSEELSEKKVMFYYNTTLPALQYERLYREIHSLPIGDLKDLYKSLSDEFIGQIDSKNFQDYVISAKRIMELRLS